MFCKIAAAALVGIALSGVPAYAALVVRMNTPGGLSVFSDDEGDTLDISITGIATPEGTIAAWNVARVGCLPGLCVRTDDPSDCEARGVVGGLPFFVQCVRRTAGVTVQLRSGNDKFDVYAVGGDAFSIDAGPGDDRINQGGKSGGLEPGGATGTWQATLGSGDDLYKGSNGPDFVSGGSGDDQIQPEDHSDGVSGGSGNDLVFAGPESERTDHDAYDGGSGFDTLSYSLRTTTIFVAKIASTGGSGSEDSISNFERITGGSGNDSLLGFSSNGRGGDDVLTGSIGDDTIVGGTGADIIRGFDGDDVLDANDAIADTRIECGAGKDTALLDLRDPTPSDDENCELIDRRAIDEEAAVVIATTSAKVRDGRVHVPLRCPRAVHRPCAGTLTVAPRGGAARSARYRVRAGYSARVGIRLAAADIARVRRAPRGRTAIATSRERGLKGAETVSRHIKLR